MKTWNGGKCPVDGETIVRVKVNVWEEPIVGKARDWFCGSRDWWHWHEKGLARIVGYEVVA
jgi:hypothetical protein